MSTTIKLTNGNILTSIPDTKLETNYAGLDLIGKFYPAYNQILNSDLVYITENFADSVSPNNPLVGQLWYDTNIGTLKYWNGSEYKPMSVVTSDDTAPLVPQLGDMWYNTVSQQLFIWGGYSWILIGPPGDAEYGSEGWRTANITSGGNVVYFQELYSEDSLMTVASSLDITSPIPPITGFGNIRAGFNFVTQTGSGANSSGIYNITDLTLGDSDQMHLVTDNYDNGYIINNGNTSIIISNSNATANLNAYHECISGNVTGTVYVDTLIAGNDIDASSNINVVGDINVGGTAYVNDNLVVINSASIGDNLNVLGVINTEGGLNVSGNAVFNAQTSSGISYSMPENSASLNSILQIVTAGYRGVPAVAQWDSLISAMSLTANGYVKLGSALGGLIIQWGTQFSPYGTHSYTWPSIPFPHACLSVIASDSGSVSIIPAAFGAFGNTTTLTLSQSDGSGGAQASWIAIGF
jgi:hypothetical protein